jgi:hypothetical protein
LLFLWKILSWLMSIFLSYCLRIQILLPYRKKGRASLWCTSILEEFWTQVGMKVSLKIPIVWANVASFCWIHFIFIGNFTTEIFKIPYL